MNKPSRFLSIAILPVALAFAQGLRPGGPGGFGSGPGTPPDPAAMIQMRVSHLTTLLSLTDAQKTQAATIFTNAYTLSQGVHTSLQSDQQSLSSAVKTNNTASIDQLSASIGALQGQLTAINSKADAAFYAILTPDQQTKYDSMPHGGPGGGFGRGFRGGPPPR